jgi:hypothetical protein
MDQELRDRELLEVGKDIFPLIFQFFNSFFSSFLKELVLVQKSHPWNIATKGTGTNEQWQVLLLG